MPKAVVSTIPASRSEAELDENARVTSFPIPAAF
jgi:hypothetical protein